MKLRFRVLNDGSDPQSYRAEVCEICRKLNEFQQLCVTLTENLCFRMGSRWNPRLVQSVGFGPVWDSNAGSHLVSPDASAWDSLNRQPGPGSSISLLHSISHPTYCPTYLPRERDYNLFKLRKKLEIIISIHIRIRVSQHRCSPVRRLLF